MAITPSTIDEHTPVAKLTSATDELAGPIPVKALYAVFDGATPGDNLVVVEEPNTSGPLADLVAASTYCSDVRHFNRVLKDGLRVQAITSGATLYVLFPGPDDKQFSW